VSSASCLKMMLKNTVYVLSDDYKGFIRNPLPSFWTEDLSEAYAGVKLNEEKKEEKEPEIMPRRIEGGLKIWFKREDAKKIVDILDLSIEGVTDINGKSYYPFDLKRVNGKYCPTFDNLEGIIKEIKEKDISIVVDVDSEFPLTLDDVILKIPEKKTEQKRDKLTEYADKIEL